MCFPYTCRIGMAKIIFICKASILLFLACVLRQLLYRLLFIQRIWLLLFLYIFFPMSSLMAFCFGVCAKKSKTRRLTTMLYQMASTLHLIRLFLCSHLI